MKTKYQIVTYSRSCKNAEEAAKELGLKVSGLLKSLLVESGSKFVLILISSDKQLSFDKLNTILDGKYEMANIDEVFDITGYHIGVVSPFNLKTKIPIIMDESCLKFTKIGVGSGTRGEEIILSPRDLVDDLRVKLALLTD